MVAMIATRPTCDARIGVRRTDFGMEPLWCHQWVGLRSFIDRLGARRYYCSRHELAVVGRYGEMPVAR